MIFGEHNTLKQILCYQDESPVCAQGDVAAKLSRLTLSDIQRMNGEQTSPIFLKIFSHYIRLDVCCPDGYLLL